MELLAIHSKYKGLVEGYLYGARSLDSPSKNAVGRRVIALDEGVCFWRDEVRDTRYSGKGTRVGNQEWKKAK